MCCVDLRNSPTLPKVREGWGTRRLVGCEQVASIAFRVDICCGRVYLLRYRFLLATGTHRQFAENWQPLRNIGQKLWLSLETSNTELEIHPDSENNL